MVSDIRPGLFCFQILFTERHCARTAPSVSTLHLLIRNSETFLIFSVYQALVKLALDLLAVHILSDKDKLLLSDTLVPDLFITQYMCSMEARSAEARKRPLCISWIRRPACSKM